MLWLKWFVGFLDTAAAFAPLSKQAHIVGHAWLDRIERTVVAIIVLRLVRLVRPVTPRKGVAEYRRKGRGLSRAVFGSKFRRSLRSKDLRERITRLTQNIDALVARLLRRLPCGLTRRRPIKVRRALRALRPSGAFAYFPLLSDTS